MGRKPAAGGGLQLRAWPRTYPRQHAARRLPRHPAVRWLRGLQEIRRVQVRRSSKASAEAQMLEGKDNLLRLQQQIPLSESELAAVEEGIAAYERLIDKL